MKKIITYSIIFIAAIVASCNSTTKNKVDVKTDSVHDSVVVANPVDPVSPVITLNDDNFSTTIKSGVVLVDFWATWCRPCRMQGPVIDEIKTAMGDKVKVGKLDIDNSPVIANKYGIRAIPHIIIFKDGKIMNQYEGLTDKQTLLDELNTLIK